ncbi:hypothetical protein [Erythrobacter sp. YT30]|uniref:hypothetical protein n=1 Tax=Erythrobacter sp. YT30 TaxID=1735012 RepID=UPI000A5CA0F9|nr:hypothetical protein [Erythrobacter sp. YT30]
MTNSNKLPHLLSQIAMAAALIAPACAQDSNERHGEQTTQAREVEKEIIVEGAKNQRKAILKYIRANVGEEPAGQYAKFEDPICPSVFGFTDNVAQYIETRMRDVAEAAKAKVAGNKCNPNVHLVIVEDGPNTINELRAKRKGAFGQMLPYARRELSQSPGPVYEWRVVSPIGMDGNTDRSKPSAGVSNDLSNQGGGVYALLTEDPFKAGRTNVKSRILQSVRQRIGHAVVLIEKDAVIGLSPTQIADFGVLTALARPDGGSDASPSRNSIRSLFDVPQEEAPEMLTNLDLALLTSLYAARGDLRASGQRAAMVRVFERTLEKQSP